jgi:hypothetical protein
MSWTHEASGGAERARRESGSARRYDFGIWRGADEQLRASWHEESGELRAEPANGGRPRLLARLPASGHPDPRRSHLIGEAALHGWAERSGRPGSLDWLERRLGELRRAELEPIDWTVACPSPGCPRQGAPVARDSDDWGEGCDSCLGPRLVRTHGLTVAQLEAQLRHGRWQLADARSQRMPRGMSHES